MNRRARRADARRLDSLCWAKVQAKGTYLELGEGDARDLLLQVFKLAARESAVLLPDDQTLFDSVMNLIRLELLHIWFALDGKEVRVRVRVDAEGEAA